MRDNLNAYKADIVVVGAGVLGLLLAKKFLDFGQRVVLLERSPTIAKGPSIKNHGWIHYGTTHSLSADSLSQARETVSRVQYGHKFFQTYAPECFDEPFVKSYAFTNDSKRAAFARDRWSRAGVPFKELTPEEFYELEPTMDPDAASFYFEVNDSRLNNRLLFMKLYTEIKRKGALILTDADYQYLNSTELIINSAQGQKRIQSEVFLYATGTNIGESYKKLTGETLRVRKFKSHLLFMPRLSNTSIIGLDYGSPIIVNHGDVSIVNRANDDIETSDYEPKVIPEEVEKTYRVLSEIFPEVTSFSDDQISSVACLKPTIQLSESNEGLNIEPGIYEPRRGHIFALPGKMTAAPYVADTIVKKVYSKMDLSPITLRPFDETSKASEGRQKVFNSKRLITSLQRKSFSYYRDRQSSSRKLTVNLKD